MSAFIAVFRRELRAYFGSSLAYVFIGVYLLLSGLATWNLARFFDTARVELTPFFQFQPWFLAFLAPAIGMRLWSEDLKSGASDLYFTAPVSLTRVHLAKFSAGMCVIAVALASSLPYWLMVSWLGSPDHGVIALNYLHLLSLGALFLMVSLCFSAVSKQQVIALVLSALICLVLLVIEINLVTAGLNQFLPGFLAEAIRDYGVTSLQLNALRGVFQLSDFLVYAGLTALFAVIGVSILDARRRVGSPKPDTRWLAASLVVIFIAFPFARNLAERVASPVRLDVTGYQLNTLSDGAKELARGLEEPIELTLYYSETIGEDYPNIRAHADRVMALLSAFEKASRGKIRLEIVDPEPFSAGEDEAILAGISAIPTEGLDPLYFGLTGRNLVDDLKIIPFFAPEQDDRLEFDIANLIAGLDEVSTPKIGVLSGTPALSPNAAGEGASAVQQAISDAYLIEWISPDALSLPENMAVLLIAQPPEMAPHLSYLIETYLAGGGRALILTDPHTLLYERQNYAAELGAMAENWGIELSRDILADAELGLTVSVNTRNGPQTMRQPVFIGAGSNQMNRSDFLTAGLQKNVQFGTAGWISNADADALDTTPLITSSDAPARMNVEDFLTGNQSPASVRAQMQDLPGPLPMAVRLSGNLPSRFDAAPDPELPEDPVLSRLGRAQWSAAIAENQRPAPAEIVWIHDTDLLFDAFYLNPQTGAELADNRALILSVLDQFAGKTDLSRLRARPPAIRPMTRIVSMRRAAEDEYLDELTRLEDRLTEIESQLENADENMAPGLRAEYLNTRRSLRDQQSAFREKIGRVETWLRWLTIWLPAGFAFLISALIRLPSRRSA